MTVRMTGCRSDHQLSARRIFGDDRRRVGGHDAIAASPGFVPPTGAEKAAAEYFLERRQLTKSKEG
jgi:hypothetical protein